MLRSIVDERLEPAPRPELQSKNTNTSPDITSSLLFLLKVINPDLDSPGNSHISWRQKNPNKVIIFLIGQYSFVCVFKRFGRFLKVGFWLTDGQTLKPGLSRCIMVNCRPCRSWLPWSFVHKNYMETFVLVSFVGNRPQTTSKCIGSFRIYGFLTKFDILYLNFK